MAIQKLLEVEPTEQILPPDDPLAVTEPTPEAPVDAGASSFIDEETYLTAMLPGMGKALRDFKFSKPKPSNGKPPITIINVETKAEPTKNDFDIDPKDLTPEEVSTRIEENATRLIESDLSDFDTTRSHQINMDTIHVDDQAKATMAQMAEAYSKEIDEARRGVIKDEQLLNFANELGTDPKFVQEFLNKEFGQGVNAEQILAARSILEASAKELKVLANKIYTKTASTRDEVDFLNQFDFHRQWMAQFMGARAELGRGMRALGANPQTQAASGEPVVANNRMEELVAHWGGQLDVKIIAEQIVSTDTFLGVNKLVKASKGGMNKYGAAFVEHFVGSLLSGIKTQVVNLTGNALMTAKGPLEVAIAARFGRNLPADADRVQIGEAQAMLFGMFSGFRDAIGAMAEAFKTGEGYGGVQKFEVGHNKAISSEALGLKGVAGWMADVYGPVARFPMERLLGPMDAFFKVINERAAFSQLAFREAMRQGQKENLSNEEMIERLIEIQKNPELYRPGMMQEVVDYGLYSTFQNPLGTTGQNLQKVINSSATLKTIAPFVRTPVNILKVGFVESTPLGLASEQYKKDVNSGGAKGQIAQARVLMGTTIMTIFGMYAMTGKITGSGPKDSKDRNLLMATGWRPRSIRFDNDDGTSTYFPYGRFEPLSLPLGLIADITEVMQTNQWDDMDASTEEKLTKALNATVFAIAENTINKSYMQGVNDAMKAIEDPSRYMKSWITNMANAAIAPGAGLRRDLRKLSDEYMKEAVSFTEKLRNSNPYFADGIPDRLDLFGEPQKYEVFLNPHKLIDVDPDSVDRELQRLLKMTGQVAVTKLSKKQWQTIDLNSKQYYSLQYLSRKVIKLTEDAFVVLPGSTFAEGQPTYTFKEFLARRIVSPDYQEKTDFEKVKEIQQVQQFLDEKARSAILLIDPELKEAYDKFKIINPARRQVGDDKAREQLQIEINKGNIDKDAQGVNF